MVEVEVGGDGLVRTLRSAIRTRQVACRRPIHKLCLLEAVDI
jgi:hypothetical protein